MASPVTSPGAFFGWVETPDVRGTLDIIYSCVVVLVTAIWTVIHLNIPAKTDSWMRVTLRRCRWGALSIFAPDLLTLVAVSQWEQAKKSVGQMGELDGVEGWTMVHAFYANSGGFFLQPEGGDDDDAFPVNAETVHWLVSRNYIAAPAITRDEIWDKSKADLFAKTFALLQTTWIIVQSIARAINGLPLSPLELFTLAFVVSTAASYFFWWHKPQHVETPTVLYCAYSMRKILADAGVPPDASFVDTPLDFVQKAAQAWERRAMFREYDVERGEREVTGPPQRPLRRIPDDAVLPSGLPVQLLAALVIPSTVHCSIHLLGWNFDYPSETERLLWRISAVTLAVMSSLGIGMVRILAIAGYEGKYNLVWIWINRHRKDSGSRIWPGFWDLFLGFTTLCLVIARCYIIIEVVISLRHLPADVYLDVEWTNFIPHV